MRGSGDGGAYSTVGDFRSFWTALFAGRIRPLDRVAQLVAPRFPAPSDDRNYGLGFWLGPAGTVQLVGGDAGVGFTSAHDPATGHTRTVVTNAGVGAGAIARRLDEIYAP